MQIRNQNLRIRNQKSKLSRNHKPRIRNQKHAVESLRDSIQAKWNSDILSLKVQLSNPQFESLKTQLLNTGHSIKAVTLSNGLGSAARMRDQIHHPLSPIHWMRYYLWLLFIREHIRQRLWPLRCMRGLPFNWSSGTKSAIPFNLFAGIETATPSTRTLNQISPTTSLHKGPNPPLPLTTLLNEILPSTCLHRGPNPPPRLPSGHCLAWDIAFSLSYLSSSEITFATFFRPVHWMTY